MKVKIKDLVYVDYEMIDDDGESLGLRGCLGKAVCVRERWIKVNVYDEAGGLYEARWFRPNKVRLAEDEAVKAMLFF
jgi:hypothetical protein